MIGRPVTLLLPVALIVALLLLLWVGQRQLMHFPLGTVPPIDSLGLDNVQPVAFDTADGQLLYSASRSISISEIDEINSSYESRDQIGSSV